MVEGQAGCEARALFWELLPRVKLLAHNLGAWVVLVKLWRRVLACGAVAQQPQECQVLQACGYPY